MYTYMYMYMYMYCTCTWVYMKLQTLSSTLNSLNYCMVVHQVL